MLVLALTVGIFAIVMIAMAIGVMMSGRKLQGSCGGAGSLDCLCEQAGKPVCAAKRQSLATHE